MAIEVSDDLPAAGEDRATFERHAREAIVLDLVRRGQISMGRGARELGMDRLAFMRLASTCGIPVFDLSEEQWEAEVRRISGLRAGSSPTPSGWSPTSDADRAIDHVGRRCRQL